MKPYNSNINSVSKKQGKELSKRSKLKAEKKRLMMETVGFLFCETCKETTTNLDLSHIIALSRGGKTTWENCLLECRDCHNKYEKKPELRD